MEAYTSRLPDGSVTWKIDWEQGRLRGKIGGKEAALQSAAISLLVPRFQHLIYSNDFGSELESFFQQESSFLEASAADLVWEALSQDDRMLGVKDVNFTGNGDTASLSFTLKTFDGSGNVTV